MKLQQLLSGLLGACLLLSPALPAAAIDRAGGQEPVELSGYADGSIYRAPDGTEYRVLREPDSMIRQIRADMTGCYILAADMDLGGRTLQTPMTDGTASSLYGKRALFAGDSISFGYADTPVGGVSRAWAGRLAYRYNMDCTNASVSGATLTAKYPANRILSQLTPHLTDSYDYVILEGGFNDANPNGKGQDAPVGTVTPPGTEAGFDAATFAGALEELFATVKSAFPKAQIGFILTYRTEKHPAAAAVFATYVPAALEACEKWGVSCLNWFGDDTVNREVLATDTYTYLRDGVHPGSAAYDRLTPYVAAFMEAMQTKAPDTAKGTDTADPTSAGESAVPPSPGTDPESKPSEKPGTEASGGCRSGLTGELLPFAALAALLSVPGRKKYKTRKEEPTP